MQDRILSTGVDGHEVTADDIRGMASTLIPHLSPGHIRVARISAHFVLDWVHWNIMGNDEFPRRYDLDFTQRTYFVCKTWRMSLQLKSGTEHSCFLCCFSTIVLLLQVSNWRRVSNRRQSIPLSRIIGPSDPILHPTLYNLCCVVRRHWGCKGNVSYGKCLICIALLSGKNICHQTYAPRNTLLYVWQIYPLGWSHWMAFHFAALGTDIISTQ